MIFVILAVSMIVICLYVTRPEHIYARAQSPARGDIQEQHMERSNFTLSRSVLVKVLGDSAAHLNIFDGSTVKAIKLSSNDRECLVEKDIVIIKSQAGGSDNPFRLRQIESIDGDDVKFVNPPNSKFKELKPRDLSSVYAKVTHRQKLAA